MTDVWQSGDVTLYLGDCLEILPTLAAGSVDAVITDPPYGIGFESGWTGAKIEGDRDTGVRDAALTNLCGLPMLVFGAPSAPAPRATKATLVWHRPGSGMGDLAFPWKPDYEFIYVMGDGFHHFRRGPSVLTFPWDVFRGDAVHPHQKPVALIKYLLERCPGAAILDPFMGSGTIGVACVQLGRKFVGIEIDPGYFEIAKKRISDAQMQTRMEW